MEESKVLKVKTNINLYEKYRLNLLNYKEFMYVLCKLKQDRDRERRWCDRDRAVSLHLIQISTIFNLMNKLKSIFLYTNFYLLIS